MNPIDFSSLEKRSETINQHSDELTKALTAINDKLNSLNLGIEVIDGPTLEIITESDTRETRTLLGYGKLRSRWGLLVTTRSFRKTTNLYNSLQEQWVAATTGDSEFLLSSPRRLRIEAIDRIERLVELLQKEADNLEVAVGKAKKIAQECEEIFVGPRPLPS